MVFLILLSFVGLLLIFLEFFLPGMVFAMGGAVFLLTSASLFFYQFSVLWGLAYLACELLLVLLVCKIALWQIKRSRKDELCLSHDQEGYVALDFDSTAVGKKGFAFTDLKPAGHVLVDGKQLQALSETGYVQQGEAIQVVGGKGGHVLVRTQNINQKEIQ